MTPDRLTHRLSVVAIANLFARRYDKAIEILWKVVEMASGYVSAHINLAEVYEAKGSLSDALEEWDTASRLDPAWFSPVLAGRLRAGLEESGARGYWEAFGAELETREAGPDRRYHLVRAYAQLGRLDEAFAWLEGMVSDRDSYLGPIRMVPAFDPLRSDPRFDALLERMGFE